MYENFKKSPQNPFNQAHMARASPSFSPPFSARPRARQADLSPFRSSPHTDNATKEDKVEALQSQKAEIARRFVPLFTLSLGSTTALTC